MSSDVKGQPNTAFRALGCPGEFNTWTYLTGVLDASDDQEQIYVNGALKGTATDPVPFAANGPLAIGIGQGNGGPINFWADAIANVEVFNSALMSAQVKLLSTGRSSRKETIVSGGSGSVRRAAMYGENDLSSAVLFAGNFINFGYWEELTGGRQLRVEDRIASQANLYRTVLRNLGVDPTDTVVEVGCGIGVGAALALREFNPSTIHGVRLENSAPYSELGFHWQCDEDPAPLLNTFQVVEPIS